MIFDVRVSRFKEEGKVVYSEEKRRGRGREEGEYKK